MNYWLMLAVRILGVVLVIVGARYLEHSDQFIKWMSLIDQHIKDAIWLMFVGFVFIWVTNSKES